jgi:hypothetical protein
MSGMSLIAAVVVLVAPCASPAQNKPSAPPRGSNSAHTARSSGPAENRWSGVTIIGSTALGSGKAKSPSTLDADAAIQAENNLLDCKLKSICRGCQCAISFTPSMAGVWRSVQVCQ